MIFEEDFFKFYLLIFTKVKLKAEGLKVVLFTLDFFQNGDNLSS